jgi:hypothetical protein
MPYYIYFSALYEDKKNGEETSKMIKNVYTVQDSV